MMHSSSSIINTHPPKPPGEFLQPAPPPPPPSLQPDSQVGNHHNPVIKQSRPSSQLSHNGSSGYGSTRSHGATRPSPDSTSSNSSNGSSQQPRPREPQFASLRVINRIKGELREEGRLGLEEAEVDSIENRRSTSMERNNNVDEMEEGFICRVPNPDNISPPSPNTIPPNHPDFVTPLQVCVCALVCFCQGL